MKLRKKKTGKKCLDFLIAMSSLRRGLNALFPSGVIGLEGLHAARTTLPCPPYFLRDVSDIFFPAVVRRPNRCASVRVLFF